MTNRRKYILGTHYKKLFNPQKVAIDKARKGNSKPYKIFDELFSINLILNSEAFNFDHLVSYVFNLSNSNPHPANHIDPNELNEIKQAIIYAIQEDLYQDSELKLNILEMLFINADEEVQKNSDLDLLRTAVLSTFNKSQYNDIDFSNTFNALFFKVNQKVKALDSLMLSALCAVMIVGLASNFEPVLQHIMTTYLVTSPISQQLDYLVMTLTEKGMIKTEGTLNLLIKRLNNGLINLENLHEGLEFYINLATQLRLNEGLSFVTNSDPKLKFSLIETLTKNLDYFIKLNGIETVNNYLDSIIEESCKYYSFSVTKPKEIKAKLEQIKTIEKAGQLRLKNSVIKIETARSNRLIYQLKAKVGQQKLKEFVSRIEEGYFNYKKGIETKLINSTVKYKLYKHMQVAINNYKYVPTALYLNRKISAKTADNDTNLVRDNPMEALNKGCGNCYEIAYLLYTLIKHDTSLPTELKDRVSIARLKAPDDHAFVVIKEMAGKTSTSEEAPVKILMVLDAWVKFVNFAKVTGYRPKAVLARDKISGFLGNEKQYMAFLDKHPDKQFILAGNTHQIEVVAPRDSDDEVYGNWVKNRQRQSGVKI